MTVLNPQDSIRLLTTPDHWRWVRAQPSVNFGGAGQGQPHYKVSAWVFFVHHDAQIAAHPFTLYVAEPHPGNLSVESLLGRDILSNYIVTFDQLDRLTLDVPPPVLTQGMPGLPSPT